MKIVGIIPARYSSSRFPGKPLMDICGKTMIQRVYENAIRVKELSEVYVATDDERIQKVCISNDLRVILTSQNHMTGMDRVGEVATKVKADLYVNIQGDEPLLEPNTILKAIQPFFYTPTPQITNLMTAIRNPVDLINNTIPKVVTNKDGIGIYLSRGALPSPKGSIEYLFYKQVCVYGVKSEALQFFCDYGKKHGKAKLESIEDIEILRFIENGYHVQFIEVDTASVAVDTPNDLEVVRVLVKQAEEGK